MAVPIYISGGKSRYVGGTVYELTGKDISGDTYQLGLSLSATTLPAVWFTPDVATAGTAPVTILSNGVQVVVATTGQRILKCLVSATTPATSIPVAGNQYYCWASVVDSPEIEPILLQGPIITA